MARQKHQREQAKNKPKKFEHAQFDRESKNDKSKKPKLSQRLSFSKRVVEYFKTHRKQKYLVAILLGLILVALLAFLVFKIYYKTPVQDQTPVTIDQKPKPKPKPEQPKFYSALTGQPVANADEAKKPITGVMIENSPQARPQSGLNDAEVVYEAIAEGGITRFLALYQQNKPDLLGPVRSLRMYYIDWLKPWDASVAHVGGSYKALQEIRNGKYKDIDQFFNAGTFWRTRDRYAPHNVYTNFQNLDKINQQLGHQTSNPKPFARDDSKPAPAATVSNVNVVMSSGLYNSSWQYQPDKNTYLRSQAGQVHANTGGNIESSVVVILKMNMNHVFEDGWREDYATRGAGDAVVFQNGSVFEVKWEKPTPEAQFAFKNQDDSEFKLTRGKVWLTAIPVNQGGGVSWQ